MLTKLRIQNFKAWRDTGEVRLAPLTVFFGTNSSGKSSLEQFFLMLQQTVESTDRKLVLNSGDRDSAVNLGAFDEFIHRRNRETKLSFNFEWQLQKNISVSDPKTDKKWEADAISFDGSIGLLGDKQPQPRVEHFSYQLRLEGSPILEVGLKAAATETYKLSAKPYSFACPVASGSWAHRSVSMDFPTKSPLITKMQILFRT